MRNLGNAAASGTAGQSTARGTDGTAYFTPGQTAARWAFHPESVRRILRRGQIESIILGRRRLIPLSEIERVEREGLAARAD